MEGEARVLLRGRFVSPGPGGARYELSLTPREVRVARLAGGGHRAAAAPPAPTSSLPLRHVLSCRVEPAGEAADLVLLCYLPKGKAGRQRRGDGGGAGAVVGAGGRRRTVKVFRVDGDGGNRATAERWAAAIGCLLAGVELPGEEGSVIVRGLVPRARRLLLFVNPRSGRSLAMKHCHSHIIPMLLDANISYNLIRTEHQNHARALVQEIKLSEWDGVVIVSGDGLMYEVINGLMERPDWERAIRMPLGILPAGSGNALAASVNHNAGYPMALGEELLVNCTLLLCRGWVSPMDLVSVTTASGHRHFSCLSVAWGFVADVDIESERFRGVGAARFSVGTLLCLASLRRYRGRLSYLPAPPPRGTGGAGGGTGSSHSKPALRRSVTATGEGSSPTPGHTPLGRALSEDGLWRSPPDSPSRHCEGFSFEAASMPELEEEEEGEGAQGPPGDEDASAGGGLGAQVPPAGEGAQVDGESGPGPPVPSAGVGVLGDRGSGPGARGPPTDEVAPGVEEGGARPCGPPSDHLLPPLDQPVPGHWETLEGDFVLVLAVYQSHLGSDLVAAPFARFSEGRLHLCYVRAGISRRSLLRLFLAMGRGTHFSLACPYLHCVPALAFRLEPLTPHGIITIDGERVEYGPLQAQVHGGMARLVTGVPQGAGER